MKDFWKVAHRGWHKVHVENTLEAFRAAYDAGCDMVEFDVQLSRDGVPVVFHDDDCRRLAGKPDNVFDLTWEELRGLSLRAKPGRVSSEPALAYRIPSLEQFLAEFGKRAFYLELKIPQAVAGNAGYVGMLADKCAAMVKAAGPHPDTFLASFHGGILRHLARTKAFPILGGIFEDYDRFREVHSGKDADTAVAIRHFSVSWDIFRRYVRDSRDAADRNARQAPVKPSELDLLERKVGVPDPDLFLIWDIHGEKEFKAALSAGVHGLVADDVELMLRMARPAAASLHPGGAET
jgi:glycerophosphoryl diester phosphodiesterase